MAGDESESLLSYVGVGGAVVCCVALELLGGATILGGLATLIGLSTGLAYLVLIGIGGLVAALLALGYRQFRGVSHV